jgi:hypothetical protein
MIYILNNFDCVTPQGFGGESVPGVVGHNQGDKICYFSKPFKNNQMEYV